MSQDSSSKKEEDGMDQFGNIDQETKKEYVSTDTVKKSPTPETILGIKYAKYIPLETTK